MKDISRHMMPCIARGDGARITIQARKVAGARFDTAAGLHAYAKAANFHIARNDNALAIDDAMDRAEHTREGDAKPGEPDEALAVGAPPSDEHMNRVYGRDASPMGSKSSPFKHRMMTWAFVNFLARPSHILLSQMGTPTSTRKADASASLDMVCWKALPRSAPSDERSGRHGA